MTKIARHGRMLDTAPPTVGPMAGATVMTSEPTPISRPTLLRGDCSRMMFIISGVATPEPMPWMHAGYQNHRERMAEDHDQRAKHRKRHRGEEQRRDA